MERKHYWHEVTVFLSLIIFTLAFFVFYKWWQFENRKANLTRVADQIAEERARYEDLMVADAIGGRTPHETLRLYIEAVEKGDYELASKYFVIEKQTQELARFESGNATEEKISRFIFILRQTLSLEGQYTYDGNFFSFDGTLRVDLTKYPSGNWKLVEI